MTRPIPFIWYELMTTDADAAADFYGSVIGWRFAPADPAAPVAYRIIQREDDGAVGGALALSEAMQAGGARPGWLPYLAVADLEAALATIAAEGGKVLMPRTDIPEGSFAMVSDPQGAPVYVMQPVPLADRPDATSDAFKADGVQHARWNELATSDPAAAKAFYARHFGFAFNHAMPMGEAGEYAFIDFDGAAIGAVMPIMDPARPPSWLVYFGVPSVVAARAAVACGGGTVILEPHEVPGGDWVVVATDPQGAPFGVVGPRGE